MISCFIFLKTFFFHIKNKSHFSYLKDSNQLPVNTQCETWVSCSDVLSGCLFVCLSLDCRRRNGHLGDEVFTGCQYLLFLQNETWDEKG